MATSGTYSFTCNRNEIIRQAMLNIGKLDADDPIPATEMSDCAFTLNMLVKQWQGKSDFAAGLKVWTRRRGHLFLSSTQYQYVLGPSGTGWTLDFVSPTTTAAALAAATSVTLSSVTGVAAAYYIGIELASGDMFWTTVTTVVGLVANLTAALPSAVNSGAQVFVYQTIATQPIVIEAAVLRDTNNEDTPLKFLRTTQDYDNLPSKTDPTNISDPSAIYYEFQLGSSYLYTDVAGAQDVTKHIVLTYMEAIQDFNNPTDEPEYPQEMFLTLCWGLAKEIAPMFHATWTQLMQNNYENAMAIGKKKDAEVNTMFYQPGVDE
jgi:hypothetical protein